MRFNNWLKTNRRDIFFWFTERNDFARSPVIDRNWSIFAASITQKNYNNNHRNSSYIIIYTFWSMYLYNNMYEFSRSQVTDRNRAAQSFGILRYRLHPTHSKYALQCTTSTDYPRSANAIRGRSVHV